MDDDPTPTASPGDEPAGTDADGPAGDNDGGTVTRIGGQPTGPAADRVTTGVLAADATSRGELGRRRRWLVGGAVLGVVVVLAFVLGVTLAADIAQDRAAADAALADAEADLAMAVVVLAEGLERPALQVGIDAPVLQMALEDHLVVTDRTPDDLASTVERTSTSLAASADELDGLAAQEPPTADPLVDAEDRDAVLTDLEQLRVDAEVLVEELRAVVDAVGPWTAAVTAVDEALAAHTAVVEGRGDDTDPAALAAGWEAELEPLGTLVATAADAAAVPGLEAWATAHEQYAQDTRAFVEEAVALLETGELEEYNALFLATFGTDDPFGFQAAARTGATVALESDPIAAVVAVDERAAIVVDAVTTVERTVVDRLGDDG